MYSLHNQPCFLGVIHTAGQVTYVQILCGFFLQCGGEICKIRIHFAATVLRASFPEQKTYRLNIVATKIKPRMVSNVLSCIESGYWKSAVLVLWGIPGR